jgi:hypothetical protein
MEANYKNYYYTIGVKSRDFVFNLLSVRGEDLKMCFLQRRLGNAAKKALSKIPTKNIKSEDKVSYFVW